MLENLTGALIYQAIQQAMIEDGVDMDEVTVPLSEEDQQKMNSVASKLRILLGGN